ncbi:uncharacterized protein EI97DRAFT_459390 [Westerdykella ornata]|uniref:Uncharacterized protein n=1 Tax=Westerdykella ornata TaxID=318751 RepID=A0A6A6JKS3_WESOR|nr:uncharacterized protein EI97DRAFT_459390 [Westerdykella ornata]KAF2275489.1 hypothetical protein EI97DRAFT_459390 [Westerdykella ornata]
MVSDPSKGTKRRAADHEAHPDEVNKWIKRAPARIPALPYKNTPEREAFRKRRDKATERIERARLEIVRRAGSNRYHPDDKAAQCELKQGYAELWNVHVEAASTMLS